MRCFPQCARSRPEATLSTESLSPPPQFPLCDLRDLCAMLFPMRDFPALKPPAHRSLSSTTPVPPLWPPRPLCDAFPNPRVPAQKPPCPPKAFRHHPSSPSVTSVTSVRCFSQCALFPSSSHLPTEAFRPPRRFPLCGLRDLCAMLSGARQLQLEVSDSYNSRFCGRL